MKDLPSLCIIAKVSSIYHCCEEKNQIQNMIISWICTCTHPFEVKIEVMHELLWPYFNVGEIIPNVSSKQWINVGNYGLLEIGGK